MKIETILKEVAWDQGYDAFRDGLVKDENPHKSGTNDYYDWLDGWNAQVRDKAS